MHARRYYAQLTAQIAKTQEENRKKKKEAKKKRKRPDDQAIVLAVDGAVVLVPDVSKKIKRHYKDFSRLVKSPDQWWISLAFLDALRHWHGLTSVCPLSYDEAKGMQIILLPMVESIELDQGQNAGLRVPLLPIEKLNLVQISPDAKLRNITSLAALLLFEFINLRTLRMKSNLLLLQPQQQQQHSQVKKEEEAKGHDLKFDPTGEAEQRALRIFKSCKVSHYRHYAPDSVVSDSQRYLGTLPAVPSLLITPDSDQDYTGGRLQSPWIITDTVPMKAAATETINMSFNDQLPTALTDIMSNMLSKEIWKNGLFFDCISSTKLTETLTEQWLNANKKEALADRTLLLHNVRHAATLAIVTK
jgi:hypothetical protein